MSAIKRDRILALKVVSLILLQINIIHYCSLMSVTPRKEAGIISIAILLVAAILPLFVTNCWRGHLPLILLVSLRGWPPVALGVASVYYYRSTTVNKWLSVISGLIYGVLWIAGHFIFNNAVCRGVGFKDAIAHIIETLIWYMVARYVGTVAIMARARAECGR